MGQHRHNQKKLQYNHTHNLVKKGTNTLLKSDFSEIRVRTWVQVVSRQKTGLWLADLSGIPIGGLFFGRKPLELMSSDLRKKLTLSEIYTDQMLMIDSCWDFNFYENAFASEIPGSIPFNFLIYAWNCCDSLILIQYINFFACLCCICGLNSAKNNYV